MITNIIRAALGVMGAAALFVAANVFMTPEKIAGQLGLALMGDLGVSTFRGDVGSLFAASGLFMLAAAIRGNRAYLVPPLVYTGIALGARTATAAQIGFQPEFYTPMAVEAVTVLTLVLAYATLGRKS